MQKRYFPLIFLLFCLILAAGCRKSNPEDLESTTDQAAETTTEEATTDPAVFPGLIGCHEWWEAPDTSPYHSEDGSIALLSSLSYEAHVGNRYVTAVNVLPGEGGKLFVIYSLSNYPINPNSGIDFYVDIPEGDYDFKQYFLVFDPVTGEKAGPVEVSDAANFYSDGCSLTVTVYTYDEETWDVQRIDTSVYDTKANLLHHTEQEPTDWTLQYTTKDHIYYEENDRLYCKAIGEDGSILAPIEVTFKDDLLFSALYGAFTQADKDYVQIYCRMMDLLYYTAIIDVSDGSLRCLKSENDPGYLDIGDGYYSYEDTSGADFAYKKTYYLDDRSISVTNDQTFSEGGYENYVTFLGPDHDRLVHFSYIYFNSPEDALMNTRLYVAMYDTHTGETLGYASYDMGPRLLSQLCRPVELSDGRLLIFAQGSLGNEFYIVDFSKATAEDPYAKTMRATVTEGDLGTVPELPNDYTMDQLVPGEVWPQYADLKQRAAIIGEKHGIDIRISDECKQLYGDYLVCAENRRAIIEESLTMIDTELDKYPDDFIEKLTAAEDGPSKLTLYLPGTIRGRGDGGTLDFAGGFQSVTDDSFIIMLDIESPFAATSSLHHELSHAIENRLMYKPGENIYDYDTWLKLCPDPEIYGEPYSYNYMDFGNEKLWELTYYNTDEKNVYYIDSYCCTNAGEDRARLFENAMCRELSSIDLAKCPHLLAKLNYYADCIEAVFGYPIIPAELRVKDWRSMVFDE